MTNEQILEQLFDNDQVIYEFDISPKIKVKIRNLTPEDYNLLEAAMLNLKGTRLSVTQEYALKRVGAALLKYKNTEFSDKQTAEEYLSKLSAAVLDKLVTAQNELEKNIRVALGVEAVGESFFDKAGSLEKPELLQKELSLESQEN